MIEIYYSKNYSYIKYHFLFFNIRTDQYFFDFNKIKHLDCDFKNHCSKTHSYKIYKGNK